MSSKEPDPRTVLVTGGAGYVGSHTCLRLAEAGYLPVTYDNLSNGHRDFVQWGPLEVGDIRDVQRLTSTLVTHRPVAVIHFAGLIEVSESFRSPLEFYDANVIGALNVAIAARRAGVKAMVFSSTCATYGEPHQTSIDEAHPQAPLNPYGRTKLIVEQALVDLARFGNLPSTSLRYFNAAGADPRGRTGERHSPETHAIPLLIAAAFDPSRQFTILGDDYPSSDGTAVRDYVHVLDLADAHINALERLLAGGDSGAFNLGSGRGTSVLELAAAVERATGCSIALRRAARRPGDAPVLIANNGRARMELGWRPRLQLEDIIISAVNWHRAEFARAGEWAAGPVNLGAPTTASEREYLSNQALPA